MFCCSLWFWFLMVCSCVGNAMATPSAQQQHQDYFRSVSSESTTYMMVPAGAPNGTRRREAPSKMWLAMVVIVVVVLQIASTTGLFLYLNMSISQVRSWPTLTLTAIAHYFAPHVGSLCRNVHSVKLRCICWVIQSCSRNRNIKGLYFQFLKRVGVKLCFISGECVTSPPLLSRLWKTSALAEQCKPQIYQASQGTRLSACPGSFHRASRFKWRD